MSPAVSPYPNASSQLWWTIPAVGFLVLLVVAMLFGRAEIQTGQGTSYDASGQGFRAAYLLLEELGFSVTRARRPTGGAARFVFFPTGKAKEAGMLADWIRGGGIVVLADDNDEFARDMGIELKIKEPKSSRRQEQRVEPEDHSRSNTYVEWPGRTGRQFARNNDRAVITIYPLEKGELWLLNEPYIFENRSLRTQGNAELLCRMAGELQAKRAGSLAFDEYIHGLRDRPNMLELLFRPPTLWITMQSMFVLSLVIWHFVIRFGAIRPERRIRRRSKDEFLDAMGLLLERKGDYRTAYATARENLLHELATLLGLPPGASVQQLIETTESRKGKGTGSLLKPLEQPLALAGKTTFLKDLNQLEIIRDRFFEKKHDRQPL